MNELIKAVEDMQAPYGDSYVSKKAVLDLIRKHTTPDDMRERVEKALLEEINQQALDSIEGREPTQSFERSLANAAIKAIQGDL